jgi:hypothetical protein
MASLGELTKGLFPTGAAPPPHEEGGDPPAPPAGDAPKPPAAAPDPDPAAGEKKKEDELPPGLTERGKSDFAKMRESKKKTEDENAILKKKVTELETALATVNPEEGKALKAQLADYEERLIATNLEKHPKFQAYFNQRTESLLASAKAIGGEKIASLIQLPESEYRSNLLQEEFTNLNPLAQARLGSVLNDLDALKNQRETELNNSRDRWKALQKEQQERAKAQVEQHNSVLTAVLDRWSDPTKGVPFMQDREGDKEWNAAVERRKQLARDIFTGNQTVEEIARASAWAAVAPELVAQLNGAKKREDALREEVAQLKAAKPSVDGGAEDSEESDSKMGFMDKVNKEYRRAR